ncbi:hypothetical protein [Abyssalbus ytuae]|uniref:Right handed beta helix domain-containing protein n=1 Tax=Abyssalbus ytuae TaxID=2926907 RepID=A0A9E7CUK4_9FLAO|nr:hypothetical protein [Abyssalbus ytuae]UOB18582.1 hypothetical protein MQE35_04660 [Abyssalbus ytuae]
MKKYILYIVSFFMFSMSFGQETKIKYRDLDTELQSQIDNPGVNPNVLILSDLSQLADPSNSGKIIKVQNIFTMTNDITIASNIILIDDGGIIHSGGFSLTPDNTMVLFNGEDIFLDFFTGTIVMGSWIVNKVYATNIGAVSADNSSTDNRNSFINLLNMVNSSSGTAVFNKGINQTGIYYMSASAIPLNPFYPNRSPEPTVYIGNGYDGVTMIIEGDVTIKKIPDNLEKSLLFQAYDTKGSKLILKGRIEGDRNQHNYITKYYLNTAPTSGTFINFRLLEIDPENVIITTKTIDENISVTLNDLSTIKSEILDYINNNAAFTDYSAVVDPDDSDYFIITGPAGQYFKLELSEGDTNLTALQFNESNITHENNFLFTFGSNSDDFIIEGGGTFYGSSGDAIICTAQLNGSGGVINFVRGDVNFDTGELTSNASGKYVYAPSLRDFSMSTYSNRWFYVGMNALSTVITLYPNYWVLWYDENDNFIESSPLLEMHRRVNIKPQWKKARLIFDYTPNYTSFFIFMDPKSLPLGGVVKDITFDFNRRQHISNPPPDLQIINCRFKNVGGASPGFDIDWEDLGKYSTDGLVQGCTFENSASGSLIIKGAEGVKIIDNVFETPTDKKASLIGVSTGYGRKTNISNNTIIGKNDFVDISSKYSNNYKTRGYLNVGAGGSLISDNVFENIQFRDGQDTGLITEAPGKSTSVLKNNIIRISKPWIGNLINEYGNLGWENNQWFFNDKSILHYTTNIIFPLVEIAFSTNSSSIQSRRIIVDDGTHNGYYKNEYVRGIKPNPVNYHNIGWELYAQPIDGYDIDTNLSIRYGFMGDKTMNNVYVREGWLRFYLDQFTDIGTGEFPIYEIKNTSVNVPAEIDENEGYLLNTNYGATQWTTALRTPKKDVNFIFINCSIHVNGTITGYLLKMDHNGTTLFDNCVFSAETPDLIDFNDTERFSLTLGEVTFIDPEFKNVSTILRAKDEIIYTHKIVNNTQTAANYNTVKNDRNDTVIRMENASANTVTIISGLYDTNDIIKVRQSGTGTTTLVADSGVTINGTLVSPSQYALATLHHVGGDTWEVTWQ